MKKYILTIATAFAAAFTLTSCDKETEGLTGITYYPVLELAGDDFMIVDKGSDFVDPGCSATLNGEDVTDQVTVAGEVDTATSGIYSLTYSVKNSDGFAASVSRTVAVFDSTDPAEGLYATSPSSYRLYNGAQTAFGASFDIIVINEGDYYSVDDFLGGWYCQRAGYGSAYAMQGWFTLDEEGNMTLLDSYLDGWGDSLTSLEGTFDAATSTFSWNAEYTDYPFNFYVTMTKQ